jgi:hypothetical protein
MKRISGTIILGCAVSVSVAAVYAASASAESARSSYGVASAKDGGIANDFGGKDGGVLALGAKEAGAAPWESLTTDYAKDGGSFVQAKEAGSR